jgi:hypothetical protein
MTLALGIPQEPYPQQPFQRRRNPNVFLVGLIILLVICLPIFYTIGQNSSDSAAFDFYYVKPEQKFGADKLADCLKMWTWIKPYKENVFDCSEMSAYLEWKLENEGWHTLIIVGDSPFSTGKHAWLLVETEKGKYTPVESTNIVVIRSDNPNFGAYFKYDRQFETIQEALSYNEADFDWWAS